MKEVPYNQYAQFALDKMADGGVFLSVKDGPEINTMTMGWGAISYFWGKPTFIIPVRESRYTHEMLECTDDFTISVPNGDELKEALVYCGTHSGRDVDKFEEMGMTPVPGMTMECPIVGQACLFYECKIVARFELTDEYMDENIERRFYRCGDYHTLYFGEIKACYIRD